MNFHSLGELASEEPSESGRNVHTLHLRKPLPLRRRCLALLLQREQRRQQDVAGESCVGGRCTRVGPKESDSGTARWIGDQLQRN